MWVGRKRWVKIPAVPQCSVSGPLLIVAPRVLLKIIVVFCSTVPPWHCVLPLLHSAFESCRKWGRIFGSWGTTPWIIWGAKFVFGKPQWELCWCLGAGDQSLLALCTPGRKERAAPFPEQGGCALLHILNFHLTVLLHNSQPGWFIRHLFLVCKTFHRVDKRLTTWWDLIVPNPLWWAEKVLYLLSSYFCILDTREHF